MDIAVIASIALGAGMLYGITRNARSEPWGHKLALACFAALVIIQVSAPDDGCHTEWDGRSNPAICD